MPETTHERVDIRASKEEEKEGILREKIEEKPVVKTKRQMLKDYLKKYDLD